MVSHTALFLFGLNSCTFYNHTNHDNEVLDTQNKSKYVDLLLHWNMQPIQAFL